LPEARCSDGWCEIPSGCFIMGSPENEWGRARFAETPTPVHLTRSFLIGSHEVTQQAWTGAGFVNPSGTGDDASDCLEPECPVGNVTLYEVAAYANHLSVSAAPPLPACYRLEGCAGQPGTGMKLVRTLE
jgi:formylglycine-generating enzyme required for sulfatase activity